MRKQCFESAPTEVVGAVISNDRREVLCALRGPMMTLAGYWEFPGGKLVTGESPERALVREILEELNCDITVGRIIADHKHTYPNISIRLRTFDAKIRTGEPTAKEHESIIWLPASQLHTLNWAPADLPTVKILAKRSERDSLQW